MSDFSALKMRKSQMIAGFGVGAIVEIDNQSLIAKDISQWSSFITRDKKYRVDSIPRPSSPGRWTGRTAARR